MAVVGRHRIGIGLEDDILPGRIADVIIDRLGLVEARPPQPVGRAGPDAHPHLARRIRDAHLGALDLPQQDVVGIPGDVVFGPFEPVGVEILRRIEAQRGGIIVGPLEIVGVAAVIGQVDAGRILAEELEIDLVLLVAVDRAGIGEKRRIHAGFTRGLHPHLVDAVAVEFIRLDLAAGVILAAAVGIGQRQRHEAAVVRHVVRRPGGVDPVEFAVVPVGDIPVLVLDRVEILAERHAAAGAARSADLWHLGDRQVDGAGGPAAVLVDHPIGEPVGARVIAARLIGEGAVLVQRQRSMVDIGDQRGGQRVAIGVPVICQHIAEQDAVLAYRVGLAGHLGRGVAIRRPARAQRGLGDQPSVGQHGRGIQPRCVQQQRHLDKVLAPRRAVEIDPHRGVGALLGEPHEIVDIVERRGITVENVGDFQRVALGAEILDRVEGILRDEAEDVVLPAADQVIGAAARDDHVIAVAADDRVVTLAAVDDVVALEPVEMIVAEPADDPVGVAPGEDPVIPGAGIDRDHVVDVEFDDIIFAGEAGRDVIAYGHRKLANDNVGLGALKSGGTTEIASAATGWISAMADCGNKTAMVPGVLPGFPGRSAFSAVPAANSRAALAPWRSNDWQFIPIINLQANCPGFEHVN